MQTNNVNSTQTVLVLNLSNFLKQVYKFEEETIFDNHDFIDTSWIKVTDSEAQKFLDNYRITTMSIEDAKQIVYEAMSRTYEQTYNDNFYKDCILELQGKIEKDFENLNSFFCVADGDVTSDDKLVIDSINWKDDTITFSGNLVKFEEIIIQAINGYGSYHYNSLEEFRDCNYGDDSKENIESHLHWLVEMEAIYGTIHNFFEFDLSDIEAEGSTDYTNETMEEIMIENGIEANT